MKSRIYYLCILFAFNACTTSTKEAKEVNEEKNVIHLTEAIANPVKMNLSEIVDSVKFVPISSKEHLIRGSKMIDYSKPYLMVYPGCIYNMQGEFVGNVGAMGQGPGEESGYGYSVYYDENKKSYVRNIIDKKIDISLLGAVTPCNMFIAKDKKIQNTNKL